MSNTDRLSSHSGPILERPHMPGYGIQEVGSGSGLISWDHVREQLKQARNYWISSTRPDGRPHAAPVWGVWLDETFFFGTGARSQKARNIAVNPWMVVHLESGDEAVILEGSVERVMESGMFARLDQAYSAKYDWRPLDGVDGDMPEDPFFAIKPRIAYAWLEQDFPGSATRYRFS